MSIKGKVNRITLRRSRRVIVVFATAVAASALCVAPAASSSTPSPKSPITAAMSSDPQGEYGFLAGDIQNSARKIGSNGFVGSAVVPQADRLELYWFGDMPAEISKVISNSGLRVDIHAVPYSRETLHAEAKRLLSHPAVITAGVGHDFQSMNATVLAGTLATVKSSISQPIPVSLAPGVRSRFPEAGELHVAITSDTGQELVALERQTDTPAFWGGSTIVSERHDVCTTSFTATHNATGDQGIVTAQHCVGDSWDNTDGIVKGSFPYITSGGQFIGRRYREHVASDSTFLIGGHSYGPYVYNGGPRSITSLAVQYWTAPPRNWGLSENGALSGEVSGVVVTDVDQFSELNGIQRGPGFWTTWTGDRFGSAGEGDSGGVAHRAIANPNGNLRMQITGIIGTGDPRFEAPCRAYAVAGRRCFKRIFHPNIEPILQGLNVTPKTVSF